MVFLKAPRPGLVKTRLGHAIGMAAAAGVYRTLAEQQLSRIPPSFRTEIHYAPRGAPPEMRRWLGNDILLRAQCSGDLGARLKHAFAAAFARAYCRVIAIGSDCPQLDSETLLRAERKLDDSDLVLGPASDGGYYLIGLRRPMPRLFENIAWSTETVCAATMERANECGISSALLEVKDDIDDLAALLRHQLA